MFTIENQTISALINPKGAELISLFHKTNQLEYMWQADPSFWAKSSPILFPTVGALKDNLYLYKGEEYLLPRHGFARERDFEVEKQTQESITFLLQHDEETLKVYPFSFEFRLHYRLKENQLYVTYQVTNIGEQEMWFSVGGHPAFRVPLVEGTSYEDYYLEFEQDEELLRWLLADGGLIGIATEKLLGDSKKLPLTKDLFYQDALVFKHLESESVILKSDKTPHQLRFDFKGFPFLGLWAAKDADFVCIEPWCGIADSVNHNQELTEKEGIHTLEAGEDFERTWKIELN